MNDVKLFFAFARPLPISFRCKSPNQFFVLFIAMLPIPKIHSLCTCNLLQGKFSDSMLFLLFQSFFLRYRYNFFSDPKPNVLVSSLLTMTSKKRLSKYKQAENMTTLSPRPEQNSASFWQRRHSWFGATLDDSVESGYSSMNEIKEASRHQLSFDSADLNRAGNQSLLEKAALVFGLSSESVKFLCNLVSGKSQKFCANF